MGDILSYFKFIFSPERYQFLQEFTYPANLLSSYSLQDTAVPRHNEVPTDWENVFVVTGVRCKREAVIANLWETTKLFVMSGFG